MSEFLEFVLWKLQSGLLLVLLAGIAAGAVVACVYWIHKKKYNAKWPFPWRRTFLWLLLLGYLLIVVYATLMRWQGGYRQWNLHLFRAWREAWNNFSAKSWANVLLNIAMFVPLGFLLPLFGERLRRWYVTIPIGFGASALIEAVQLLLNRGVCDVDDLLCNGVGAAVGYFLVMALLSLFAEKGKRLRPMLGFSALALVPVVVIGGIFGAYQLREFGNLPEAASHRVNLEHLNWQISCSLPEKAESVPVYRTGTRCKADCDAFAEEMAALTGQEIQMVSYYQEMAYYNLTWGFMMVYYHDGSFELNGFDDLPAWLEDGDRQTVEDVLAGYGVTVPEAAVFRAEEEGWYRFTCEEHREADTLLDGTLKVQLGADGTLCRIENSLVSYTHHADMPVISPQDAWEKVKNGEFLYAEALSQHAGDRVTVSCCSLDYQIDTKGFYQPVYRFEIMIPETGNICEAMIPALK